MTETEQQIACWEWMGWDCDANSCWNPQGQRHDRNRSPMADEPDGASLLPPLTRDTLQPMLEKMTEEQWEMFRNELIKEFLGVTEEFPYDRDEVGECIQKSLTCPLPILVERFMLTVSIWKE